MENKDVTAPATKADIEQLARSIEKRFDAVDERLEAVDRRFEAVNRRFDAVDKRFERVEKRFDKIEERLSMHDRQFEVALEVLSAMQDGLQAVRRDLRIIADRQCNDHERRLLSCERRLGLAI